jgi:hypothetical protein
MVVPTPTCPEGWVKVIVGHDLYASAQPSGENSVITESA